MRIVYVSWDPLRYPRIDKIARTVRKCESVKFDVMIPKFKFVWGKGKIGRLFFSLINYFTVLAQIFFTKADFFWVANCPDILVIPLIFRKKRYVLGYRSPWSLEVEGEFGRGPWTSLSALIERYALSHAWIIDLTTSRLMTKVKYFGKPVFVIPNYPLEGFGAVTVPRSEFRREHGQSEADKIVLFVGKLSQVEGADMLPAIIENVRRKTDVVFWIVGDGPMYPQLAQFVEKFPKQVKLFGWQPHREIPNFIAASDICIAPRHISPYSVFYNEEGVSKLSEYMFFEKPIIACGIAESKEYLLVDGDKMAGGILKVLEGKFSSPMKRTWEEYNEETIYEIVSLMRSSKP